MKNVRKKERKEMKKKRNESEFICSAQLFLQKKNNKNGRSRIDIWQRFYSICGLLVTV